MSINNSPKYDKLKNNCNHLEQINKNKELNKSYFYCFKCNHIILLYNNKAYCIYKCIPKDDEEDDNFDKIEFDPILIVRSMIKREEEQNREINEKFVLNFLNNKNNDNFNEKINRINNDDIDNMIEENIKNNKNDDNELIINDPISLKGKIKYTKLIFDEDNFEKYCEYRNTILQYINKLCTKLKYNDNSFYLTLYLADTYLSRIISDDITEKELFLVILGFLLISSKYIEDDIFEPDFERFCNIEKSIETLTIDEIRTNEVQCLTLINHNLIIYTVFDWINILLNNGIIFEEEINNINEIEKIFTYSQKILTTITSKFYFCRYSTMQIAFSIIHLSREKYINKNNELSEKLYKLLILLYGVEFSDYEECYNIIKIDLSENNEIEEEENSSSNSNNDNIYIESNRNSLDINRHTDNKKALRKERNNYDFGKISRKNKNVFSVDSNKCSRYLKTDININRNRIDKNTHNLISSLDQKKENSKKYKLNNNYYSLQNNSLEILDNIIKNKKLTPNIITNTNNNNSLNYTSVKTNNYDMNNKAKNLIINVYKKNKNKNLISSDKYQKANNILYINYAPKLSIRNTGSVINNINYINNINTINLYSRDNKNNKNINNINSNSNLYYLFKKKNNKNNKEIKNSYNHLLRKTLFDKENMNPIQLNYEYDINSINNNKIKKGYFDINHKMKKLKIMNKEKFRTHLLLDFSNNLNINNIFRNINNQIPIIRNKETKSFNKYDNSKNMNILKENKKEVKILNTNINLNNNNINSKKITLNFKDIANKKINSEHFNKFLLKNNVGNSKRFSSLQNNFFNRESKKNLDKKYIIFNSECEINNNNDNNNGRKNNLSINDNINNKDNIKNNLVNENGAAGNQNNIINYNNIALFKSKLPKLRFNKKSLLENK